MESTTVSRAERAALSPRERLILALDVPTVAEAEAVVAETCGAVGVYKIGLQLAFTGGIDLARRLKEAGERVFLDVKLHDIANTVESATRAIAGLAVDFITVHAYPQTMRAAVAGRGDAPTAILAVTVLTSMDDTDLAAAGYRAGVAETVMARAQQAAEAGIDGLVCSPREAADLGARVPGLLRVTPGIRPAAGTADDQKRVTTPAEAVAAGADLIVVGRPILAARNRRAAAEAIVAEIAGAVV